MAQQAYVLTHEMPQHLVYATDQAAHMGGDMPQFPQMALGGPAMQPHHLMMMGSEPDDEANKKNAWTKEEDERLCELVAHFGPKKWSIIAQQLGTDRVGKQCRERWHNHLSPAVRKDHWTEEEDKLILDMVNKVGTKWSQIVKLLPGRTDNAIKNRWNSAMRKSLRKQQKTTPPSATPPLGGYRGQGEGGEGGYTQAQVPMLHTHLVPASGATPGYPSMGGSHGAGARGAGMHTSGVLMQTQAAMAGGHAHAGSKRWYDEQAPVLALLFPNEMSVQLAKDIAVRGKPTCAAGASARARIAPRSPRVAPRPRPHLPLTHRPSARTLTRRVPSLTRRPPRTSRTRTSGSCCASWCSAQPTAPCPSPRQCLSRCGRTRLCSRQRGRDERRAGPRWTTTMTTTTTTTTMRMRTRTTRRMMMRAR
jgi:hypothetical protein